VAPGGCVGAVLGPATAQSEAVTAVVPRTLRLGSRGPDVVRLQRALVRLRYLPPGSVTGSFDERTWHAVVAFEGWQRLGRDGVADRRVWTGLARAGVPRPWGGLVRGVEIDRARQVLLLVEGGRVVRAVHVSTGAYGRTPAGRFAVRHKERLSWSVPFRAWMPYANYFYGGYAVHGFASVPAYPASHGCVRVPMSEAPAVYAFATVGTPVWIR
jgi:peptidoglycan hydrolase-like protein with peptidoglycan-binding domain